MIAGLALYPLSDAFIKHLMGTYSVYQTTFLRSFTRLIPLFITVFFQGGVRKVLGTNHPKQHLIRLAVSLAYTLSFMLAMKQGSLTIVYTLSYTSSFFMILLSALMLKETVSRERWIAVAVGMIGVIIALRPGSNMFETVAILVLLGTFLGALNKILMRRLAETEHSLAIAIYPNIVMIAAMIPCFFIFTPWKPMPLEHWGLFAIVGIITAAGQYAIAQALRFTQASVLAPVDYSTYFWVVAFDLFWWHKPPDKYMVIGAIIIVGSNLFILYRTRREEAAKKAAALATAGNAEKAT
jgi:drug/metabolite transporter (DMT)-like permease